MCRNMNRKGTLLITVMALIALMLALTMSAAIQVNQATAEVGAIQREAQCFVMATNTKILAIRLYQKGQWRDDIQQPFTVLSPNPYPRYITIGDQPGLIPNHPLASSLGWARIDFGGNLTNPTLAPYGTPAVPPVPTGTTGTRVAWPIRVVAAGGASGAGGVKSLAAAKVETVLNSQRQQTLAYEHRRYFDMTIHGTVQGTCNPPGARPDDAAPYMSWSIIQPNNAFPNFNSLFP